MTPRTTPTPVGEEPVFNFSASLTEMTRQMIRREAQIAIRNLKPHRLELFVNGVKRGEFNEPEYKHAQLEHVMALLEMNVPVLLVGPSGSGKTHLTHQAARLLGLPFEFQSIYSGMSEGDILGRKLPGPNGQFLYYPSGFVRAYKDGGIYLADEIDAGDPNTMAIWNSALANNILSVPLWDECPYINRHPNFRMVGGCNTIGHGADRKYTARNALDAATLDRFRAGVVIVDYDTKLEKLLGEDDVCAWAWNIRKVIGDNRLRHVMSTRSIIVYSNLKRGLQWGMPQWNTSYFADWTEDEIGYLKKAFPEIAKVGELGKCRS